MEDKVTDKWVSTVAFVWACMGVAERVCGGACVVGAEYALAAGLECGSVGESASVPGGGY